MRKERYAFRWVGTIRLTKSMRLPMAERYGLTLLPNSTKTHDAVSKDGKYVQIKATQVQGISISSEPDYLIAIKLFSDGSWEEVYNGPGKLVWDNAGKLQKNGQRPISLNKLKKLMTSIQEDKIAPVL